MPGYWIARSKIIDPKQYKLYTDRVPAIMAKYGGKILSRCAQYATLEGSTHFERFVLIEFESFEATKRCFQSPEYTEAAELRRHGAAENEMTAVDSGEFTR